LVFARLASARMVKLAAAGPPALATVWGMRFSNPDATASAALLHGLAMTASCGLGQSLVRLDRVMSENRRKRGPAEELSFPAERQFVNELFSAQSAKKGIF